MSYKDKRGLKTPRHGQGHSVLISSKVKQLRKKTNYSDFRSIFRNFKKFPQVKIELSYKIKMLTSNIAYIEYIEPSCFFRTVWLLCASKYNFVGRHVY